MISIIYVWINNDLIISNDDSSNIIITQDSKECKFNMKPYFDLWLKTTFAARPYRPCKVGASCCWSFNPHFSPPSIINGLRFPENTGNIGHTIIRVDWRDDVMLVMIRESLVHPAVRRSRYHYLTSGLKGPSHASHRHGLPLELPVFDFVLILWAILRARYR